MKKFIFKTLLFSMTIILVFGIWLYRMPMERNNYLYEQNIKDSLMQHTPSPRIIFASGSSLAFGLDSHRIQDSLHINVINDGLHAGVGLKYILDGVNEYVRQGDIVVIALEYTHLYTQMYGDATTLSPQLYYTGYRRITSLNLPQLINVISGLHTTIRTNIKSKEYRNQRFYTVMGFNDLGDEVGHWYEMPDRSYMRAVTFTEPMNDDYCMCFMNQISELEKKGAKVIITPPPFSETHGHDRKIGEVSEFLKKNGRPFNVPPQRHLFPDSLFFDTEYHLSKNGVDVFTGLVIEELRDEVRINKDKY